MDNKVLATNRCIERPRFGPNRLAAIAMVGTLLVACGGGNPDGEGTKARDLAVAMTGARVAAAGAADHDVRKLDIASRTLDANTLFDWAEQAYPQFFPGRGTAGTLAPYVYRYYPSSGNYLGVDGANVQVLGPMTGGQVVSVGTLEDLRCRVYPADCADRIPLRAMTNRIAIGSGRTMVVNAQGAVLAWGDDAVGTGRVPIPDSAGSALAGLDSVVGVYNGYDFNLAVTRDGRLWGWGVQHDATFGPRVSGPPRMTTAPVLIPISDVVSAAVCARNAAVVALKSDGTVWQIPGTYGGVAAAPVKIGSNMIALGEGDVRPLTEDCNVMAFGADGGVWTVHTQVPPRLSRGGNGFLPPTRQGSCSPRVETTKKPVGHCLFITQADRVWAEGENASGQLGIGTQSAAEGTKEVDGLNDVKKVIAYGKASYALARSGELFGWGDHVAGGTASTRSRPVRLFASIGPIADFAAGEHLALLMRDGTVMSFGANSKSELGDGTRVVPAAPVTARGVRLGTPGEVNMPPVSGILTEAAIVEVGRATQISGMLSSDANSDRLSFRWSLSLRPPGSAASLVDAQSPIFSFTPDVAGRYDIQLVVNDGVYDSSMQSVTISAALLTSIDPVALANQRACQSCHAVDKKIVGPSYTQIAAKYALRADAETYLRAKIQKGGSGIWGPVPMPPEPQVSELEAGVLARWILGMAH